MSKDGTNVREIVAQWLRENHYDGLCNAEGECGCGLDDLMPCQCINERECVCAYEIPVPDGNEYDRMFSTSNAEQNYPSDSVEQITRDLYEWMDGVLNKNWCLELPQDLERYRKRLDALGVQL
ncbi:hypothetical protein [Adlercreutzia sp.]|jgi:hypothetical protein|uniref:hypothetical protein n=1 Tax=Adlercreutzia sp. TaxID=1872387 RepID=UPI003A879D8E